MEAWSLYDSGPGHPFENMAVDERLLDAKSGRPVLLRLYGWAPPGLSLGYFQKHRDMADREEIGVAGAVITRRMTGGDAILHMAELTFSLVGKEGDSPFDGSVESSYHRIHQALAEGFRELGISARLRGSGGLASSMPSSHEGRCFYRVTRYDLVVHGAKLVGSAQRRIDGKVLHHGSIPLAANPMTPEAADLSGLAGRSISYEEAARVVKAGFERIFSIRFEPWSPDGKLLSEMRSLAESKYGSAEWIRKR